MPVVIRLMRAGAKKRPFYRMVAADSRRQRDGRFLEILGHYDPLKQPHTLVVQQERVAEWLSHGAQPSEQVASLLRGLGMTLGRPSKPKKKAAVAAEKPAKKAVKRAAPKKVSERKAKAKADRAAGKKKPAVKKAKAK